MTLKSTFKNPWLRNHSYKKTLTATILRKSKLPLFAMMSPESYPTLFPFSSPTFWHTSTGLPLSYGPMVLSQARYLYPLSTSSRRRHPCCTDEKRASSFTIDAILGLREAEVKNSKEKQDLKDEMDDLSSRQTRFEGVGKLQNRQHTTVFSPKLPASHIAFVPGCLAPLAGVDEHTDGRPRLTGDIVEESAFKGSTHEDFKFLGSYGTVESCRQGLGRDDSGLKRSTQLISWTDEAIHEQTKPKRVRTIFTQDQLDRLENEFSRQQYMVGTERLYLASQLDLSESQVKVWFQNRRIKWRKQNLEQQQHKLAKYRALRDNERKGLQCDDDPKVNDRFDEGDVTEGNVCEDKERKTITTGKQSSGKDGSFDPATARTSSPNYLLQTHELRV